MISVLIVDDQDLVREGLRMLLEAEPDLAVAGEAGDGGQALDRARVLDPDVILMDVRMPEMNGIEATARLVQSGARARILMLTTFNLDEYVYRALKAGASGFLLKDASREQLADAVRSVAGRRNPPRPRHHPATHRGLLPRPRPGHRDRRCDRAPERSRTRCRPDGGAGPVER